MPDGTNEPRFDFTRREAMVAGGGLLAGSIVARRARASDVSTFSMQDVDEVELTVDGLQYFTIEQAELVHELAGRIYPADENGPGAKEAGVVYFVDRQLNDQWGQGGRWYMEGPFAGRDPTDPFEGEPEDPEEEDVEVEWADEEPAGTQGWQYAFTPAEAWSNSLEHLEEYCEAEYGESFLDLSNDERDQVVEALQNGEVDTFEAMDPSDFFLLVRENTLEGMFADPMYGGNQDMIGWRLKNFPGTPGALGSYRDLVQDEEYIEVDEPRSIADDVESQGFGEDGDGSGDEEGDDGGGNETDGGGNETNDAGNGGDSGENEASDAGNGGDHSH